MFMSNHRRTGIYASPFDSFSPDAGADRSAMDETGGPTITTKTVKFIAENGKKWANQKTSNERGYIGASCECDRSIHSPFFFWGKTCKVHGWSKIFQVLSVWQTNQNRWIQRHSISTLLNLFGTPSPRKVPRDEVVTFDEQWLDACVPRERIYWVDLKSQASIRCEVSPINRVTPAKKFARKCSQLATESWKDQPSIIIISHFRF